MAPAYVDTFLPFLSQKSVPLFCERQADPAVCAEQMIPHLNAESCLLVICGLIDWTHVLVSASGDKVLVLSPNLAGPQEIFASICMLLVPYRETFCVEMPFSFVHAISQAGFILPSGR